MNQTIENPWTKEPPATPNYASIFDRIIAGIVDSVLFLLVSRLDYVVSVLTEGKIGTNAQIALHLGVVVLTLVTYFGIYIYAVAKHARTPGMMMCNLWVYKDVNDPAIDNKVGYKEAFMREAISLLAIVAMMILGALMVVKALSLSAAPTGPIQEFQNLMAVREVSAFEEFSKLADGFHWVWLIAQGVSILMSPKKQSINDHIASTIVVKSG